MSDARMRYERCTRRWWGSDVRLVQVLAPAVIVLGGGTVSLVSASKSSGHPSSCDGLRAHLMSYFERASRVWDPDPWTYSVDDTASWRMERMPSLPAAFRFHPPIPR